MTHNLSDRGRRALDNHFSAVMQINNVTDVNRSFAVVPTAEQALESLQLESVEFLSMINVVGKRDLMGKVVGLGTRRRLANRVSRANLPRTPLLNPDLKERGWALASTLFDTGLTWEMVDEWSKFADFSTRYSRWVAQNIGLDRICIGFNGETVGVDHDPILAPDLQDLNIGWLQKLRLERPDHCMGRALVGVAPNQTATGADVPVEVGAAETHKNIDALAYELISGMPTWARKSTELVVICGAKLVDDKVFPQINRPLAPTVDGSPRTTDETVGRVLQSQAQIGGRPAVMVPEFPEDAMMITPLKNLSIYYQEGGRRRYIREEPENMLDLVDYNSSNEGYVIESTDHCVLCENIAFT